MLLVSIADLLRHLLLGREGRNIVGRARQLKRMKQRILTDVYKDIAQAAPPPERTYTDDRGATFVHREAPSSVWEPMHQAGTFSLPTSLGGGEVWENRWYTCSVRRYEAGFPIRNSPYIILGITHVSERAMHDWRDYQRIKNDICGAEWEGLELYPSESRLVDPSNRFYVWCVPPGVIRWGLPVSCRQVLTMQESIAPQRPFPDEMTAAGAGEEALPRE